MPLKAVLFDMDGVIVDTEPLHRKAYFKMFDEFGINVSEELFTSFTGKTTLSVCQELITRFNLNNTPQELTDKKRRNFKYLLIPIQISILFPESEILSKIIIRMV